MVMGFSVNLNFDFSGPDMGKAVDDANRAGKASLESNQTTISQTQQTTSANTFHRQNGSSVETVDLSSEVTDASKSKGFETKTGNNNTTLGKANTTANQMGTSSTKATGQSSQTGSNMNMQANGMGSRNMTGSSKENTGMGTLGESKQASIGNKGNDTKQTGMNLNTDSNKGINIKGEDFSKSDTKSLGSNKETNLDIKTGNNNQTGMNGNMSASGNGKNNGQSLGISEMDIETLGDEPVEATMKNTSVGKSQTVNTDKGGFKSIHSETVQVNEKDMEDTGGFLGGVVSFFTGLAEDVGDAVSGWAEDVSAWWNEEAAPVLQDISTKLLDLYIGTQAALVTGVISIGEGILSFGEAIVDTGAIVLTASVSVGTGIVDLGQALYGLVTGEEWESVTKQMWEGTQGFVATEHVKSWFDGFYENTEVGRFLKENANLFGLVDFDTIRSVGSGIGYTIGVVALTVLTFGVGGAAVSGSSATVSAAQLATTAGVAGFGRGTESAWKDGASLGEGLMFGGLNGVWEGFQFYIGGKIAGFGNAGNTFLGHSMKGFENKALNALTRVILDGADGGLEGFAQPLMATVYKDGYTTPEGEYVEFTSDMNIIERATKLFDSYGGWGNVATQAFIGSAMSMVGEGFDLRRYLKEGQEVKVEAETDSESIQLRQDNIEPVATLNESTTIENNITVKLDTIIKQDVNYVLNQIMDRSQITKFESLDKINELLNTRNFNVITRQGNARSIIKQYSFEQIENAYRQLYKETYAQLEADINYAVEKMLPKVGMDETKAFNQIKSLVDTGDYSRITRDGNAREILKQYRPQDIAKGLNIIFQKRQTIQSLEHILKQVQERNGISLEKALEVIENYTVTGNLSLITRQGNARDIIKSLDIEQIGEALNSIKAKYFKANNPVDVAHIFNDFWNSLNSGTQSNLYVMNLLYTTLAQAYNNGNPYALKLTQLVTELKKSNPQISLQALNYNNAYWDIQNKQLCMGPSGIAMGDSGTIMHELGHGLFDMILNGELPKNWDTIVGKSRVISSNNGTLNNFGDILKRKGAELNARAEQEFLSNLEAQGKTLESYTRELEKHYTGIFKNTNKLLVQKLKDLGYSEDTINSMINGKVTPSAAAQQQISAEKSLINDKLWRTQEGDYCALSDIVDAVFIGEKKDVYNNDIYLNYQHGKEYYLRCGNSRLYEFHEIIANFTQLKMTGKQHHIKMLRDIFGDEFVDTLEQTFDSFFNTPITGPSSSFSTNPIANNSNIDLSPSVLSSPNMKIEKITATQVGETYASNLKKMLEKGINIESYFKAKGIEIKKMLTPIEVGIHFNDPGAELYKILNDVISSRFSLKSKYVNIINGLFDEYRMAETNHQDNLKKIIGKVEAELRYAKLNQEQLQKLNTLLAYKALPNSEINIKQMYLDLQEYMDETTKSRIASMLDNYEDGYTGKIKAHATEDQKKAISVYTKLGFKEMDAILRQDISKVKEPWEKEIRKPITSYEELLQLIYDDALGKGKFNPATDGPERLIEFVDNNRINDTLVVHRVADSMQGLKKLKELKAGAQIINQGFVSACSNLEDANKLLDYTGRNLRLDIIVPGGSNAAYIEPLSNVGEYFQNEILFNAGSRLTIIEDAKQIKIGKKLITVVKCLLN